MKYVYRAAPGASPQPASAKGKAGTQGMPEAEQIRILKKQQLLTLPLLMDVCALYAPSNLALVQKLMQQTMRLLPELAEVHFACCIFSFKCLL